MMNPVVENRQNEPVGWRGNMIRFRSAQTWVAMCFLCVLFPVASRAGDPTGSGIIFPRAFFIAVDDMGWNQGSSLGDTGGPWRAGVRREFDVRDYQAVVDLGRAVGMRLQGVFLLAEMDREGIVGQYATATQAGAAFDNSANVDDTQLKVMQYVQENAAYLEFGLHGTGHEHWENGIRTRAEWYDLENDKPWPEQDSRGHVELFKRIMAQYGLTPANGQSFPESYVPCAYGYYWNPTGDFSTGKILAQNGVKYGNTNFRYITELNPPLELGGGFDQGLLMIQRNNYGNEWFDLSALPTAPIDSFKTDIIETHWPNLLAQDDFLQEGVTQEWVTLLREIQARPDRYLAKNTEQFSSQWLYTHFTTVTEPEPGRVIIDNSAMPNEAYEHELLGNLVLAVPLKEGEHIAEARLGEVLVPAYLEAAGFGYLYLPPLEDKTYELNYSVGRKALTEHVEHTGTYNVYALKKLKKRLEIDLEMYGTQVVPVVGVKKPRDVASSNEHLKVLSYDYDRKTKTVKIEIQGRDIQGERGRISLSF